jgi:formate hydrogenlyase transcriptional activator
MFSPASSALRATGSKTFPRWSTTLWRNLPPRLGRRIKSFPDETMEPMMQWNWPGNILELENFIERSVILSDGVLSAPLSELRQEIARQQSDGTLQDRERENIIDVLNQTRGIMSGPRGAAARLGLKRMRRRNTNFKKLGISRKDYLD